ncbi:MAG: O-antigen ligase family protein [Thomasclavelia sp.]
MNYKDYLFIFNFFKLISICLAVSIIVQAFIPDVFYEFAKKWFYYSNQYEQVVYLGTYVKQYSGIFYEVSFSAVILAVGILIQYIDIIYIKKNIIKKIICIIALYFSIILTGKRSFILIVPFLMLVLYFIYNYNSNRISLSTIVISMIILFFLFWKLDDILSTVINILGKNTTNGIELSSRERFWELGLNMFKSNPIIGQGINSYDIFFNQSGIRNIQYEFAGAHNSYIQLLAETGIIGFLLYLGGILKTIINAFCCLIYRNNKYTLVDKKNLAISTSVVLLLMCYGLTGNVLYQPQQLITLFMFISIIENTIKNERNNQV